MKHNWESKKLSDVLDQYREVIFIDDLKEYRQLTNSKHSGIIYRGKKQGIDIGRKRQFVVNLDKYPDTITYTRQTIQADEAIGLCPKDVNGCIVTENMPLFSIKNAEPKFIEFYFKTRFFLNQLHSTSAIGTSQKSIHESVFLDYEIHLPSNEVQKSIVEKLNNVHIHCTEIEKLRLEQLQDIKSLLYSKYIEITQNCPTEKMAVVAPITRRPVEVEMNENYPELGIRSFGKGTFHKPYVNGIDVGTKKLYYIKQGDLMFSNVFAWEGAIAVAKKEDNDRVGSHRFISCVPDLSKALPHFLCFHFLTPSGMEYIQKASPGGAGRNKTLGLTKLENIEVPLPSIEKQQEFELLLEKTRLMNAHIEQTQKELDELFPALLDKAFKGELV